jgi:hypothetical protein
MAASAPSDSAAASFSQYTPDQIAKAMAPFHTSSVGGCLLTSFTGKSAPATISDPVQPQGLDAGQAIGISGPKGDQQLTADAQSSGHYRADLSNSPYLDPGSYTFTGSGGADVGPFQGAMQAPDVVSWTNSTAAVDRSQGITVNWTGGDPNGFVTISGTSITTSPNVGAMFVCTAPAAGGAFTVPPVVTLALPASQSGSLTLGSVGQPASFTASGIDIGIATASSGVSQQVSYQ